MFDMRWVYARTPLVTLETMADDETMYGSLGRLAPAWGSDETLDGDEIYERFFAWVRDTKGIARTPLVTLETMADDETMYGSLGRLAPAWGSDETLDGDEIYERFFAWVRDTKGINPWPHQEEAIMDLLAGDHVVLNTPTGSGKSLVALGMHFAALCTSRRSYYTAPIKALVSEKFFDLVEVFGRDNVGMITGDSHINPDAPIICCTAEILANQALREGSHADIGCVAMDEFHFYGDPERGWAWQVPLLTLPQTQFLLMSATLGNVDAIARKLEQMTDADVDIIADAPRPVPLTYEYTLQPLERTVEHAFTNGETPIYVVHFSQDARGRHRTQTRANDRCRCGYHRRCAASGTADLRIHAPAARAHGGTRVHQRRDTDLCGAFLAGRRA